MKKPANRKRRRREEDGAGTPRAEEEAKRKELRATLEKKHQVDQYKAVDKRIFQLSDSYIYISVVSKGRSGSRQLNRVLKRIGAYLWAFGLHLVVAHVDSLDSPSGKGSRVW